MKYKVESVKRVEDEKSTSKKRSRVHFFKETSTEVPPSEYRTLLPAIFEKLNLPPLQSNWSKYAGCSCPCSPGFILETNVGYDIFVSIVPVEEEVVQKVYL